MANSYLFRNFTSAGNKKTFTFSAWVKFADDTSISTLFATGADSENRLIFIRHDSGSGSALKVDGKTSTNQTIEVRTNRAFRDTNAWYHIVLRVDTTQSTAADRVRIYVNGVQETSFAQSTYPSQNYDTEVNKTANHMVGRYSYSASNYLNGYMSHAAFVDGASLAPTSFGETDSTSGIWKFKPPSGVNFGTNGFHLKFENSGNLGLDSANSNNFTTQGNLKQSLSTPSTIYGTLSNQIVPWASSTVATNGNTTITCPSGTEGTSMVTIGVNTGKWYCEMKQGDSNDVYIGVGAETFISDNLLNAYSGATHNATTGLLVKHSNGTRYVNGSSSSGIFASTGSGDVTGIALDLDAATRTVTFYKNGVVDSAGAQNLPTNMQSGFLFPVCMVLDNSIIHLNTGDGFFGTTAITSAGSNGNGSLFEFDVPSNHYALNTKNINTYG